MLHKLCFYILVSPLSVLCDIFQQSMVNKASTGYKADPFSLGAAVKSRDNYYKNQFPQINNSFNQITTQQKTQPVAAEPNQNDNNKISNNIPNPQTYIIYVKPLSDNATAILPNQVLSANNQSASENDIQIIPKNNIIYMDSLNNEIDSKITHYNQNVQDQSNIVDVNQVFQIQNGKIVPENYQPSNDLNGLESNPSQMNAMRNVSPQEENSINNIYNEHKLPHEYSGRRISQNINYAYNTTIRDNQPFNSPIIFINQSPEPWEENTYKFLGEEKPNDLSQYLQQHNAPIANVPSNLPITQHENVVPHFYNIPAEKNTRDEERRNFERKYRQYKARLLYVTPKHSIAGPDNHKQFKYKNVQQRTYGNIRIYPNEPHNMELRYMSGNSGKIKTSPPNDLLQNSHSDQVLKMKYLTQASPRFMRANADLLKTNMPQHLQSDIQFQEQKGNLNENIRTARRPSTIPVAFQKDQINVTHNEIDNPKIITYNASYDIKDLSELKKYRMNEIFRPSEASNTLNKVESLPNSKITDSDRKQNVVVQDNSQQNWKASAMLLHSILGTNNNALQQAIASAIKNNVSISPIIVYSNVDVNHHPPAKVENKPISNQPNLQSHQNYRKHVNNAQKIPPNPELRYYNGKILNNKDQIPQNQIEDHFPKYELQSSPLRPNIIMKQYNSSSQYLHNKLYRDRQLRIISSNSIDDLYPNNTDAAFFKKKMLRRKSKQNNVLDEKQHAESWCHLCRTTMPFSWCECSRSCGDPLQRWSFDHFLRPYTRQRSLSAIYRCRWRKFIHDNFWYVRESLGNFFGKSWKHQTPKEPLKKMSRKWLHMSNGKSTIDAFQGGYYLDTTNILYITRVFVGKSLLPGMLIDGDYCARINVDGLEKCVSEYQILIGKSHKWFTIKKDHTLKSHPGIVTAGYYDNPKSANYICRIWSNGGYIITLLHPEKGCHVADVHKKDFQNISFHLHGFDVLAIS